MEEPSQSSVPESQDHDQGHAHDHDEPLQQVVAAVQQDQNEESSSAVAQTDEASLEQQPFIDAPSATSAAAAAAAATAAEDLNDILLRAVARSTSPRPLLFPQLESESAETIFASSSSSKPRSRSKRPPSSSASSTSASASNTAGSAPAATTTSSAAPSASHHLSVATTKAAVLVTTPSASTSSSSANRSKRATSAVSKADVDIVDTLEMEEAATPVSRTRSTRGSQKKKVELQTEKRHGADDEDEEHEGGEGGTTRCVCSSDTDNMSQGLMIQCDTCKCWQHGPCVGLWGEKDCPERYFCELCRPAWHGPGGLLRKAHRKPIPPIATTTAALSNRSPSLATALLPNHSASSNSRNKPRASADSALVSAFLAADSHVHAASATSANSATTGHPAADRDGRADAGPVSPKHRQRSLSASGEGGRAPKKRSTMNSRDAAYDDAIAMSILGPGTAAMRARLEKGLNGDDGAEDDSGDEEMHARSKRSQSRENKVERDEGDDPVVREKPRGSKAVRGGKRRRVSDEESTRNSKSRKEADVDEGAADDGHANELLEHDVLQHNGGDGNDLDDTDGNHLSAPLRNKHPNQYTYRVKNGSRAKASPAKRNGTNASTSAASSLPEVTIPTTLSVSQLPPLPTMPIAHPHPAKVRQAREPAAIVEVNAWGLPDHLKHLAHLLPTLSPAPLELPASAETMDADDPPPQLEPPTRVRFPTKRITMPEMKKRAKHVLEYMAKLQVDMSEKERRSENTLAADLGSKDSPSTLSSSPALDFGLISATLDQPLGDDGADASVSVLDGICAGSLKMMDNLTKEVIVFQQRFFSD